MKITVWSNNMRVSNRMKLIAERRVSYALRAFKNSVRSVEVFVSDINGPRGGKDKLCRLTVSLEHSGQLFVHDQEKRSGAAITKSSDKMKHMLAKKLEKQRTHRGARAVKLLQQVGAMI